MTENQPLDIRHLLYPKCPYNSSVLHLVFRLGLMAFGTVGLTFLNLWVAVVYLLYFVVFFFFAMPVKHCQYCYYKVRELTIDKKEGKTNMKLLPVDTWKESYLQKHVHCGKKWGFNFILLWLGPPVLIGISLFLNFSIGALTCLLGFVGVLAVMIIHMKKKVCPTCDIMEECHTSF